MDLIRDIEQELGKQMLPPVRVGDSIQVHYLIREGDKERVQIFAGTVISLQGRSLRRTMVVRRIVQGEGVERTFPLHSPRVKDITVTRRGNVRRAKLYYLRDRVGKGTRVEELLGDKARRDRDRDQAIRAEIEQLGAKAAEESAN
jgi:large subunit ribosomal protein L19